MVSVSKRSRPTPQTARPLGPKISDVTENKGYNITYSDVHGDGVSLSV
jgi:hypothetical protein